ncbi:branched-chain amino acid ABC transporter permease [Planosporangium flavigriseum]|uniref:branched-chain amino acid ABC transporter permease n=1 Tax=Planosporangium flavigriseum TaxID=373681 RepID=UPI001439B8D4|nr:branched-chain amino acid ABC transporter permease [Planosporangium flavigriseum]NJC63116.1 branched-chain amino acid ABC transporter permease [Planosporangium flavigriseum]
MQLLVQTLNGLTLAGIMFLVSSGFTLVFGVMRVANLAHGAFYLLGGYIAFSTVQVIGNFFLGVLVAAVTTAVLGLVLERTLINRIRGNVMAEVLLTLGLVFVIDDVALAIWGGDPLSLKLPGLLAESSTLPGSHLVYPNARLLILGVAVLVGLGLYYLLRRTRVGAIVRAGVDDREMVGAMGINVRLVFTAVFALGALLAGMGGALGATVLTLGPGSDATILTFALVTVIVGGLGSFEGAVLGSLIVGLLSNYGEAYFPSLAHFALFAPLVVVLLIRPQGVLGRTTA